MDNQSQSPPVRMTPRSQETPPENRALLDAMERRANEAQPDFEWSLPDHEWEGLARQTASAVVGTLREGHDNLSILAAVRRVLWGSHLRALRPDPGAGQAVPSGEVERLRAQLDVHELAVTTARSVIRQLEAEVAVSRAEVEKWRELQEKTHAEVIEHVCLRAELDAEVERLKAGLAAYRDSTGAA